MKKIVWGAAIILAVLLVGKAQQANRIKAEQEHLAKYSNDERILATLIEVWGEELDATYNDADLTTCPWEKGNWTLDVASEMDWERLIPYILSLPDFGTDEDYEMLSIITDGEWVKYQYINY